MKVFFNLIFNAFSKVTQPQSLYWADVMTFAGLKLSKVGFLRAKSRKVKNRKENPLHPKSTTYFARQDSNAVDKLYHK